MPIFNDPYYRPQINPGPSYGPGPTSQTQPATTPPTSNLPTGEYQPPVATAPPAITSGVGDDYVSTGGAGAGAGGSSGSWWDSLSQAVTDSGIGMPFGSTLWDSW